MSIPLTAVTANKPSFPHQNPPYPGQSIDITAAALLPGWRLFLWAAGFAFSGQTARLDLRRTRAAPLHPGKHLRVLSRLPIFLTSHSGLKQKKGMFQKPVFERRHT
jgi:hypothetical protein